ILELTVGVNHADREGREELVVDARGDLVRLRGMETRRKCVGREDRSRVRRVIASRVQEMVEIDFPGLDELITVGVVPGVIRVRNPAGWIRLSRLTYAENFRVPRIARLEDRVAIGAQRIRDAEARLPIVPGREGFGLSGVVDRRKDLRERRVA